MLRLLCFCLGLTLLAQPADALDYYWGFLLPENDSRDPEMRAWDEIDSRAMVSVIDESEKQFYHHIQWKRVPIKKLLWSEIPFCEMRFDAVRPLVLTPEEKEVLAEYLKRGGSILFFIDTYPYNQHEFWAVKEWPLIDFLTKELPVMDNQFSTAKATDDSPLFKIHYITQTAPAVVHELTGNPYTPNRTEVFYRKRLCCFVMGRYNDMVDGKWIAKPRPFDPDFSSDLKSYKLIVNVYNYSIVQ